MRRVLRAPSAATIIGAMALAPKNDSEAVIKGGYIAALRGIHSETRQATNPGPHVKTRYDAASSASANLGSDEGDAQGSGRPNSSQPEGTISSPSPLPQRSCPCGGGVCRIFTARTEKNAGRQFYRCPLKTEAGQCGFFQWCDLSQMPSKEVQCICGAGVCTTRISQTEKNKGRWFYVCPLGEGKGSCHFFKWCDEVEPASSTSHGGSLLHKRAPFCHGAVDCPSASSFKFTKVKDGAREICCRCQQVGHWAYNCPNEYRKKGAIGEVDTSEGKTRGFPNASYCSSGMNKDRGAIKSAGSGASFICGCQGHLSKDCPNSRTERQPQSISSEGLQEYKSGGQGHWENEDMDQSVF